MSATRTVRPDIAFLSFSWLMHLLSWGLSLSLPGNTLIAMGTQSASRRSPIPTMGSGLCSLEGPFLPGRSSRPISK